MGILNALTGTAKATKSVGKAPKVTQDLEGLVRKGKESGTIDRSELSALGSFNSKELKELEGSFGSMGIQVIDKPNPNLIDEMFGDFDFGTIKPVKRRKAQESPVDVDTQFDFSGINKPKDVKQENKLTSFNETAEEVPLEILKGLHGNQQRRTKEELQELVDEVAREGVNSPIVLRYDPVTKKANIGEGNHRLAVAEFLGKKTIPLRVARKDSSFTKSENSGDLSGIAKDRDPKKHFGADMKFSDVFDLNKKKVAGVTAVGATTAEAQEVNFDFSSIKKVSPNGGPKKPEAIKEVSVDHSKPKEIENPTAVDFANLTRVQSAGTPLLPVGKTQDDLDSEIREDKELRLSSALETAPVDDSLPTTKGLVSATREQELGQIQSDEGVEVNASGEDVSYIDTLNRKTGGKGHLLTKGEIKKYPTGTAIPKSVVDGWYKVDVKEAQDDLDALIKKHKVIVPDEVEKILFNMVFNMGRGKLNGFKKMWANLSIQDYKGAADEMVDSKWFSQVGDRSKRLVDRMKNVK